jgi:hypothetical protein
MSRRAAGLILGLALLLVAGAALWWWRGGRGGPAAGRGGRSGSASAAAGSGAPTEMHAFDLYFPANDGLRAAHRSLPVTEEPKDRIRVVVTALLDGPGPATAAPAGGKPGGAASGPAAGPTAGAAAPGGGAAGANSGGAGGAGPAGLVRPFPPEVKLGGVELSADGIAYVDLRWSDHQDPPESGSTEEIQRVYSVVDTVALNVPQVNRVVLLWNGTQRTTFSGHLDTSRPLVPDRTLLAP